MHPSVPTSNIIGGLGWRYVKAEGFGWTDNRTAEELSKIDQWQAKRWLDKICRDAETSKRPDVLDAAQAARATLAQSGWKQFLHGVVASLERFPEARSFAALVDTAPAATGASAAVEVQTKPDGIVKASFLRARLDDMVVGQEAAKQALVVGVRNHAKRAHLLQIGTDPATVPAKSNILMIGPTGAGKTKLASIISRCCGFPFVPVDTTQYTATGYVGRDVSSIVLDLLDAAGGDLAKAQLGIVFLDEIDKRRQSEGSGADVSGAKVQHELLKMVEGTIVKIERPGKPPIHFDTTNVLFIAAGAFAGLERVIAERKLEEARAGNTSSIGFGGTLIDVEAMKNAAAARDYLRATQPEDVSKLGIMPELIGRCPVLVTLDKLTVEDYERILTEPSDALVRQFQALFALDGVKLSFEAPGLRAIAERAEKLPTGARGLRTLIESVLGGVQANLEDYAARGISECVVTREFVEGHAPEPKLIGA
ncbi:MAG: AAA family ATPase [Myxococcota bacterium]|nr:AAA family ATPase [Myxococcota bacterium]